MSVTSSYIRHTDNDVDENVRSTAFGAVSSLVVQAMSERFVAGGARVPALLTSLQEPVAASELSEELRNNRDLHRYRRYNEGDDIEEDIAASYEPDASVRPIFPNDDAIRSHKTELEPCCRVLGASREYYGGEMMRYGSLLLRLSTFPGRCYLCLLPVPAMAK